MLRKQEQKGAQKSSAKRPLAAGTWLSGVVDEGRTKAHAETPRSNIAAGMEASTFGSGSSVLSQYEPPSEADLISERVALSQLVEHTANSDTNLEELEAVINKLQAIYFYRQGLKALAEQKLCASPLNANPTGTATSTPWMNRTSFSSGSLNSSTNSYGSGPSFLPERPSSAIPGSAGSIWRMDTSNGRQAFGNASAHQILNSTSTSSQYPGVVSTQDLASVARLQYQLYQGTLRHYKASRISRNQRQVRPNRSTRHNSAPVMLRAPQWADSSWHPMASVLAKGASTGTGTGVFIPPSKQNLVDGNQSVGGLEERDSMKPGRENTGSDNHSEGAVFT